jgi:hypothetical protein
MGEALITRRGGSAELEYYFAQTYTSARTITLDTKKNYRVFTAFSSDDNGFSKTGDTMGFFTGTIRAGSGLTAEAYSYNLSTLNTYLVPSYNSNTGVLTVPRAGSSFSCCRAYVMEIS